MDLISALEQFDLTKNEARVYAELLKLGLTNAGPLVSQTKLHRQLVYEALERLQEKKLVSSVTKNGRKHFQAASPTVLLVLLKRKEEQAKKLIPELLKLQSLADDQLAVHTLSGKDGFFTNLSDVVASAGRTDGIMRVIGGAPGVSFYDAVGNSYEDYVELVQVHKVRKWLIASEDASEEFKQTFAREKGTILKTLKVGLSSPTYTRITQEMVSIEIYANEPLVIQIYNKAIAKGYLEHFELLWKGAKAYRS